MKQLILQVVDVNGTPLKPMGVEGGEHTAPIPLDKAKQLPFGDGYSPIPVVLLRIREVDA
jgi:hypothetical protein